MNNCIQKALIACPFLFLCANAHCQTEYASNNGTSTIANTATSTVTGNDNITSVNAGGIQTTVGTISTGGNTTTASGGAGGFGGTVGNTSATGGSNSLTTGATSATGGTSTSQGGTGGSVGNTTTGASTSTSQGGTSKATTGASTSSGNTSGNTTITSNYTAPKIPVATAVAPANHPTAPCMGSSSVGGSSVLFGFSAGSSWEATECMTFEAARSFDQAGMREDALAIKCTSKYSAAAPSCIKLKQQQSQPESQPPRLVTVQDLTILPGMYVEIIDASGFTTIIDRRKSL